MGIESHDNKSEGIPEATVNICGIEHSKQDARTIARGLNGLMRANYIKVSKELIDGENAIHTNTIENVLSDRIIITDLVEWFKQYDKDSSIFIRARIGPKALGLIRIIVDVRMSEREG